VSGILNVKDAQFGAAGNGIADDTNAIQSAIDAATGNANPASTTRTGQTVYLPPGSYKVTHDLIIRSVEGFKFVTAGLGQTVIYASGTAFKQAIIFINGSADGLFEGLDIRGDGTEQVPDGIRLDWVTASRVDAGCGTTSGSATVTNTLAKSYDVGATVTGAGIPAATTILTATNGVGWTLSHNATATATVTLTVASINSAARSTTANRFRDIRIRNLKAVTLFSLTGNSNIQLDGTVMDNVVVTGGQTPGAWSSSGNWQNGFSFGNGVYANNYDHVLTGCSAALCYYGIKCNASSFDLDGSQPAANFCDFWVLTNGQTSIKNIQSQGSGQFLTSPSSFPPEANTVSDVLFVTTNPNVGIPVVQLLGGMWVFSNFSVGFIFSSGAYQTGIFTVTGQSAARPCIAIFDNLTNKGTKVASFALTNARVNVRNFSNYDPATGNYATAVAGDIISAFSAGAWTNVV
jgi:hypothetical protein